MSETDVTGDSPAAEPDRPTQAGVNDTVLADSVVDATPTPGVEKQAVIVLNLRGVRIPIPKMLVHFGGALLVVILTWVAGGVWGFTAFHSIVSLAALGYACVALLLTDALVFFLSFVLFATLGPMALSSAYIEFGNRISEQGINGFATGSTTRLAFYCLVFFIAIWATCRSLTRFVRYSPSEKRVDLFILVSRSLHALAVLGGLGLIAIYGSPLLRKQDRFEFWSQLPELFNRYPYLLAMLSFLTVAAVVLKPGKQSFIWAGALLGGSVVVLLLLSEKFTGLFSIFILSVTAGYVTSIYHRRASLRLIRLLLLCVGTAVVLLSVAAVGYIVFYGYTWETVGPKLADRALALQSHVWWGTDLALQGGADQGPMSALLPALGQEGLSGIQQLMYLVAPDDFVDRMIAQNLRFANAGFPLPIWVLGYGWATLYFIVAGVVVGLVLLYVLWSVSRLNIVSILIALNAVKQVTNAFLVGDVSDLYKPLAIVTWAWILLDLAWAYYRSRNLKANPVAHKPERLAPA